jgi:hypothetical protein
LLSLAAWSHRNNVVPKDELADERWVLMPTTTLMMLMLMLMLSDNHR